MNDLNSFPQVAVALFIIWLVVSGCCLLALTSFVRQITHTLRHWYEQWWSLQTVPPRRQVDTTKAPAVSEEQVRAFLQSVQGTPSAKPAKVKKRKKDDYDD